MTSTGTEFTAWPISGKSHSFVEAHAPFAWSFYENTTSQRLERCSRDSEVWWRCSVEPEHEWQAAPAYRVQSPNCPFCLNRRTSRDNNLSQVYPDIAKQWHPTKNGKLRPSDVVAGSGKKVWLEVSLGLGPRMELSCRQQNSKQHGMSVLLGEIRLKDKQPITAVPDRCQAMASFAKWCS